MGRREGILRLEPRKGRQKGGAGSNRGWPREPKGMEPRSGSGPRTFGRLSVHFALSVVGFELAGLAEF